MSLKGNCLRFTSHWSARTIECESIDSWKQWLSKLSRSRTSTTETTIEGGPDAFERFEPLQKNYKIISEKWQQVYTVRTKYIIHTRCPLDDIHSQGKSTKTPCRSACAGVRTRTFNELVTLHQGSGQYVVKEKSYFALKMWLSSSA